jgi:hypothetical protein
MFLGNEMHGVIKGHQDDDEPAQPIDRQQPTGGGSNLLHVYRSGRSNHLSLLKEISI